MLLLLSAIVNLFFWASCLLILLCLVFFVFFLRFTRNQDSLRLQKKSLQFRYEEQLLNAQLEMREQILRDVSLEIHDNIGQTLSLAKLNLNTTNLDPKTRPGQKVADSRSLVAKAIHDLRSLSRTLNADTVLAHGLEAAIRTQMEAVARAGSFETELEITPLPVRIARQKELIVFRIVQESVANIIKHAAATRIAVRFAPENGRLVLSIADNGCGFDAANAESFTGSGLRNMNSRARLIGGELHVRSGDTGTTITINLPINSA